MADQDQARIDVEMRKTALAAMRLHLRRLAAEVDATKRDASFAAALSAIALFWRYSPLNQWFIRLQFPAATRVAGAKTWSRLGRRTKKGVKPILILAPAPGLKPAFVTVHVFDVSQTRGRELPGLNLLLPGRTRHVRALEAAAARLGIEIAELSGNEPIVGLSEGGVIRLRPGLSQRERAATLVHELAHELLHQGEAVKRRKRPLSKVEMETEADATSYVVLRVLGLPSKTHVYIAWQGGNGAMIGAAMGRIQRAARQILEAAGLGTSANGVVRG